MEKKLRKFINRKFSLYPKTAKIIEVREELYSIMLDKYNDCLQAGMSVEESYKKAIEMAADYKDAVKEVETGSSLSALKKNLLNIAAFSTFYFIALTFIYLLVSMVVLKTFDKTWLIIVGGSFVYLVYFSVVGYQYSKLFNFKILARCWIAVIYFSLIPLLYVFPSLYLSVLHSINIWAYSWLVVIIIVFLYILTDLIANIKHISALERDIHLLAAGFLLTTVLYLSASIRFQLWSTAWIIYVLYMAIVSMGFYIGDKTTTRNY